MAESDNSSTKMDINVKTPKTKKTVTISVGATVEAFKEIVAKDFEVKVEQLCLIFAGKILKEGETLADHKITDGLTVHLVIKALDRTSTNTTEAPPSTTANTSQPNVAQTPLGLGGLGGLMGLENLGMGSSNFMEMQQNMQREFNSNPDFMRTMMDNPLVQNLMSNPDVIRQIITSNPQMSEIMDRNPEVAHMLNNPELMRQTMELARNPAMMQEIVRTQDRAMSNLESMPGGFNALQRIHRDIQEPMLNAATGMSGNPFASLSQTSGGSSNVGQENNEPLPNPWSSSTTNATPSTTTTPLNPTSGVFNTPGMQSLLTQMTQNPQLMSNMLQAPYMQSTLRTLNENPNLASEVMNNNPMFAGNPALQNQVSQMMPQFIQQMQNPEMQAMMSNPRALQAISQIQAGMQTLQQEAPQLANMMGAGSLPSLSSTSTTSTAPTTSLPATATPTATTNTTTGSNESLNNFMLQMLSQMSTGTPNTTGTTTNTAQQPPEERYASQLQQLASMGFVNQEANINALVATLGDVNGAINRLLEQNTERPN